MVNLAETRQKRVICGLTAAGLKMAGHIHVIFTAIERNEKMKILNKNLPEFKDLQSQMKKVAEEYAGNEDLLLQMETKFPQFGFWLSSHPCRLMARDNNKTNPDHLGDNWGVVKTYL